MLEQIDYWPKDLKTEKLPVAKIFKGFNWSWLYNSVPLNVHVDDLAMFPTVKPTP